MLVAYSFLSFNVLASVEQNFLSGYIPIVFVAFYHATSFGLVVIHTLWQIKNKIRMALRKRTLRKQRKKVKEMSLQELRDFVGSDGEETEDTHFAFDEDDFLSSFLE